jgi:hypothetical protein
MRVDWGNNWQWMELSLEEFAFIMCRPGFAAPPPATFEWLYSLFHSQFTGRSKAMEKNPVTVSYIDV